jgi:hypothetical protein
MDIIAYPFFSLLSFTIENNKVIIENAMIFFILKVLILISVFYIAFSWTALTVFIVLQYD